MPSPRQRFSTRQIEEWARNQRESTESHPLVSLEKKPCGCRKHQSSASENDIAVIVPCHNYGRFLAECLESVLAQSHSPAEIVVVLDSCEDDSAVVAETFRGRGVRSIEINSGDPYLARRAGLHVTVSPYVLFVDADDVLTPPYIEVGMKQFSDSVGIVTGWCQEFGLHSQAWKPDPSVTDIQQRNCCVSASLVRRKALLESRAFDDFSCMHTIGQDWSVWKKVANAGWSIAESEAHYRYRRHENNRTNEATVLWAKRFQGDLRKIPSRRPRILHVTPSHCIGGVVRHLQQLIRHTLCDWAGTVIVNGGASDNDAVAEIGEIMPVIGGTKLHATMNADNLDRRKNLLAVFLELADKADLVYCWGPTNGLMSELLQTAPLPVVAAIHGTGVWGRKGAEEVAADSAAIISVCEPCRDYVPVRYRHKVRVIYNGADFKSLASMRTRDEVRDEWRIGDRKAVGFVGRWSWEKNPLAVAEAVNVLGEDYMAVICSPHCRSGSAGIPKDDRKRAEELTGGRIIWTYSEKMGDIYAALDCLVIPSTEEGGPLVGIESLSLACPVITTPTGMSPGLERGCPDSLLFIPVSPTGEQIAKQVKTAMCSCYRKRLVSFQDYVLQNFSAKYMASQWEKVFREIAKR